MTLRTCVSDPRVYLHSGGIIDCYDGTRRIVWILPKKKHKAKYYCVRLYPRPSREADDQTLIFKYAPKSLGDFKWFEPGKVAEDSVDVMD